MRPDKTAPRPSPPPGYSDRQKLPHQARPSVAITFGQKPGNHKKGRDFRGLSRAELFLTRRRRVSHRKHHIPFFRGSGGRGKTAKQTQ